MGHTLSLNKWESTQRSFNKKTFTKTLVTSAILASSFTLAAPSIAQSSVSDKIQQLEEEIKALKSQVGEKKATGVEIKPGTQFDFGGFIKADFLYSDYSGGERANASVGERFVVPSVIPIETPGVDDGDPVFDAHAATSRLYFKTTTQVGEGNVVSYVEFDFNADGNERITNQSSNGLRHAFLKYTYNGSDSLLAGQTWSTFMNTSALPEAVDFVGPTSGTIFIRQAQLRWTKGLGAGSSFSLAAENPSAGLYDGGAGINNNNYDSNGIPDIVARYDGKSGNFSYSLAGVAREVAYRDGGMEDEEFGVGLNFAGVLALANGDKLKMSLAHGTLGRYIALNAFRDGAIEADGGIDLMDVTGGFIAYEHKWTSKLRSTFIYAYATADNPDSAGEGVNETVSNFNINLLYSPVPKLTFGTEVIFAERELESGDSGDLTRLQFMGKWAF